MNAQCSKTDDHTLRNHIKTIKSTNIATHEKVFEKGL